MVKTLKKAIKEPLSLEEEVSIIKKTYEIALAKMCRDFESMKTQHKKFTNQVIEWIREGKDTLKEHEKVLEDVKHTNEGVEEILGNVLLAIRQNEYLQAWYPAQSGFPEMKVAGIHPANLEHRKQQ